jgi:cytochrome c peroxidase
MLKRHPLSGLIILAALAACEGGAGTTTPVVEPAPLAVQTQNAPQAAVVGTPFEYDATRGGTAFSGGSGPLSYTVSFAPSANGLTASAGRITGLPEAAATTTVTVTARDQRDGTATQSFAVVAFSADLGAPALPAALLAYSDARVPLPQHFLISDSVGSVFSTDNTPAGNPTTDAGATLGRVLFYDRRLSANDRVSCGSCHQQSRGFADSARFSRGFAGEVTGRRGMSLTNARFYESGRFFWDERAPSLEAQVLQPIQDSVEMGMTLDNAVLKVGLTPYYPPLFQAAFGTPEVTSERISRALAQFVRSLTSTESRFDQAFAGGPVPNFAAVFTAKELGGQQLFESSGCAECHTTHAQVGTQARNNGLPGTIRDQGAGAGRMKVPSLRNVAVRPPYMHDGRHATLWNVVNFYNAGVQDTPNLDPLLRGPDGRVRRLNLTEDERDMLVEYLFTLTDPAFLTAEKFSDPFPS